MTTASERGRTSRDRGLRFERRVAKMFRAEGFTCRRILEFDRGCGNDLEVGVLLRPFSQDHPEVTHWLPVGIQCKATARPGDLQVGLNEAQTGKPDARLWACLHTHKRQLRILLLSPTVPVPLEVSWRTLIDEIKELSPLRRP